MFLKMTITHCEERGNAQIRSEDVVVQTSPVVPLPCTAVTSRWRDGSFGYKLGTEPRSELHKWSAVAVVRVPRRLLSPPLGITNIRDLWGSLVPCQLAMAGTLVVLMCLLSAALAGVFFNDKQPCYRPVPRVNNFGLRSVLLLLHILS